MVACIRSRLATGSRFDGTARYKALPLNAAITGPVWKIVIGRSRERSNFFALRETLVSVKVALASQMGRVFQSLWIITVQVSNKYDNVISYICMDLLDSIIGILLQIEMGRILTHVL